MVEDDSRFCQAVQEHFAQNDAEVICCGGETETYRLFNAQRFDLVLLDIMMRHRDEGYDICRWIRERNKNIPIIFVTARGDEMEQERGFSLGCHDYVVKPYSVRLLFLRVKSMIDHTRLLQQKGSVQSMHGIEIDDKHKICTVDGQDLKLTPKQFRLLYTLLENAGFMLIGERLLTDVWDYGYIDDERVVDKHISKLKKSLGENGQYIQFVPGFGYQFVKENNGQ
jgi:DNA-binding response OmpR family regulator